MNRRVNRSRRGGALIMALMVVLMGGALIAATFEMVYIYAWYSQEERTLYVDHTTLASIVQEVKARIIAQNVSRDTRPGGETLHVAALRHDAPAPTNGSLNLDSLRFTSADFPRDTANPDSLTLSLLNPTTLQSTGVGWRGVKVDVYDMYFKFDWVSQAVFTGAGARFIPILSMIGEGGGGGRAAGRALSSGGGTLAEPGGDADPRGYGAYLIRATLHNQRRGDNDPIRIVEEAFVQILPQE